MYKSVFIAFSAVLTLAGCASSATSEPTDSSDNALFGALTSPIGFQDKHMVGTWEPVNAAQFHGTASAITFAEDKNQLTYRMGDAACATPCRADGTSFVTQNPLVWFFAGTYVEFKATSSHMQTSLFVARKFDGEITLVDLDSWDWKLGWYANEWSRNPALTVNDL
jgi:hypothetical protein